MAGEAFTEYRFDELTLKPDLARGVAAVGYEQMTPIQAAAIPVLLSGKDVIGQAKTGTGKTAAFGIPLLETVDPDSRKLQALILCPTRELAMQVAAQIRSCAAYMHGVKLLPVYGGQDIRTQITGLKGTQIIVGTPGRVMDHMNRHTIKMDDVKLVILDEADEMLQMGFREDMEFILGAIGHPHQTCLFSATMPQEILDITDRFQNEPELIRIESGELTIERIEQYYYAVKKEYKTQALLRLLACYQYAKSIVFVNTKTMADELAKTLKQEGYYADALHGDLSQKQRDIVMNAFRSGNTGILIATDIAARGIDVDDVEAVFNYDVPLETEYYVHRIGRTGRAGRSGVSHTLARNRDFHKIREIEALCGIKMTEKKIPTPAAVNDARVGKVFAEVREHIGDAEIGEYSRRIAGYCTKYGILPEEFAAAFLKREVGEPIEELEIDLPQPEKKERKEKKRGWEHEGRRGDRHSRFEGDKQHEERREDRHGRFEGDKQREERRGDRHSRFEGDKQREERRGNSHSRTEDERQRGESRDKKEEQKLKPVNWDKYQPDHEAGEKNGFKKKYRDGARKHEDDHSKQEYGDRPGRKHEDGHSKQEYGDRPGRKHEDDHSKQEYGDRPGRKHGDDHSKRKHGDDRPKRKHGERYDVNFEGKRIYR